jgi:BirA family biotin operon repressor/biotin-[acetyl-CoA-carboxylase] ligase
MSPDTNPYETLAYDLKTRIVGREILYYRSLSSTMDVARREARDGAEEGTVIIAGEQTGARGRMGRVWVSPPGNAAVAVILRPEVSSLPYMVMLASLAAAGSIEAVAGLETQIKWPNDVLIGGKKVGGILIENEVKGGDAFSVLGIGINVRLDPSVTPEIAETAASLEAVKGAGVPPEDIVRELLAGLDRLYLALREDGDAVFREWRGRLVTLGKRVAAASENGVIEGMAEDVETSGALVLRLDDGSSMQVVAGDVTLRHQQ